MSQGPSLFAIAFSIAIASSMTAAAWASTRLALDPKSFSAVAISSGPETVESKGRATTLQAAREEAVLAAMRKLVGDRLQKEGDEARRHLLALAKTIYVTTETIGTPKFVAGGQMEVTVRVTMDLADLERGLSESSDVAAPEDTAPPASPQSTPPASSTPKPASSTGDLAARIAEAKGNYDATKTLMAKVMSGLPDSMITLRVVDADGKTTTSPDPRLIELDRASGKATLTIPVIVGFDLEAWDRSVHPMLEQLLGGLADRVLVDGEIVDRGSISSPDIESVPYTGSKTITYSQIRDVRDLETTIASAKGRQFVALLRENLGRGRQLNFNLYEFEEGLIPYLRPSRSGGVALSFPPRTLRVRLLDSSGNSFDGRDIELSRGNAVGEDAFGWTMSKSALRPFVEQQWLSGAPSRLVQIAPMWIPVGGFGNPLAAPELAIEFKFAMDESDAADVKTVQIELLPPR